MSITHLTTSSGTLAASRQYCTFFLAGQHFGMDVLRVQEVIRNQPLTQVPLRTAWCAA